MWINVALLLVVAACVALGDDDNCLCEFPDTIDNQYVTYSLQSLETNGLQLVIEGSVFVNYPKQEVYIMQDHNTTVYLLDLQSRVIYEKTINDCFILGTSVDKIWFNQCLDAAMGYEKSNYDGYEIYSHSYTDGSSVFISDTFTVTRESGKCLPRTVQGRYVDNDVKLDLIVDFPDDRNVHTDDVIKGGPLFNFDVASCVPKHL